MIITYADSQKDLNYEPTISLNSRNSYLTANWVRDLFLLLFFSKSLFSLVPIQPGEATVDTLTVQGALPWCSRSWSTVKLQWRLQVGKYTFSGEFIYSAFDGARQGWSSYPGGHRKTGKRRQPNKQYWKITTGPWPTPKSKQGRYSIKPNIGFKTIAKTQPSLILFFLNDELICCNKWWSWWPMYELKSCKYYDLSLFGRAGRGMSNKVGSGWMG